MSKLVIAALGGTAAAAAAGVGGIVLSGKGEDRDHPENVDDGVQMDSKLDFTTLSEFKKKKGEPCVNKSFGDVDFNSTAADASAMTKDDFKALQNGDPIQGCLVVNWEKTNYTANDKWGGGFRWLWSFRRGNSGFVMFVTTKEKSLYLEGAFYILEKKGDAWSIKKKQDVAADAQVTFSNPSNELPTVGNGLPKAASNENVDWNFITKSDDSSKFCHSNCDETNREKKDHSWSWWFSSKNMPPSGADLADWTGNLDTWYASAFKPSNLKLSEALKGIKGVWKFAG